MVATLLVASLLAAGPPTAADSADLAAYREARVRAGQDPDAQVRLALWCEQHGLTEQRARHLALALVADPSHATARALLGLVRYGGRWQRADEVAAAARSDESLQDTLAEYNARREGMPETADAHWQLALWCEEHGLKPEAGAHLTVVTQLDPSRSAAWTRLGCRKYRGRWLTEEQIAAERAEADAQRQADTRWAERLKAWWRDWLANVPHRADIEDELGATLDPRAVPTVRTLFADGTPEQQRVAALLYGRIDSAEATRELAWLAAAGRAPEVRSRATDALARRDPNEVIEPLVTLMRSPLAVHVMRGGGGNGVVGQLCVEDERAILQKTYVQQTVRVTQPRMTGPSGMNFGFIGAVMRPQSSRTAAQQLASDLRRFNARNELRQAVNESARAVLVDLTGEDQGPSPESWRSWLADRRGYAYAPSSEPKQVIRRVSQHAQVQFASAGFHSYCFARGTLVHTLLGPRPIEALRVGDQVLAEEPRTGSLNYQPIVRVCHNPPSPTLRIKLGDEEIISTPIHRFWRAGRGWALARDLKPGDTLRVLGSVAEVSVIEPDAVQPVFNLELPEAHTFLVGRQGALVHDNSRAQAVAAPFDAPLALATETRQRRP